jgi:hypothetical protein
MITKSTTVFSRSVPRPRRTADPLNDPGAKWRQRVRLVDSPVRWRKAQVIKVDFAIERSIKITIGEFVSMLGKKSKSCSQNHRTHD